jgi:hypothetical protein
MGVFKTGHHDITEILLKVVLNTITPNQYMYNFCIFTGDTYLYCRLIKPPFCNETVAFYKGGLS